MRGLESAALCVQLVGEILDDISVYPGKLAETCRFFFAG